MNITSMRKTGWYCGQPSRQLPRLALIWSLAACFAIAGRTIADPPVMPTTQPVSTAGVVLPVIITVKVRASIDGSDILTLRQDGATWEHRSWGLPSDVSINNVKWDLKKKGPEIAKCWRHQVSTVRSRLSDLPRHFPIRTRYGGGRTNSGRSTHCF